MWIQFCLLSKPNASFYTHECINSNMHIVCVLHFLLTFITFFLLVLTSKWPSIIVNNNTMPQTIFKKNFFVKLNLLQLNYIDLFWKEYYVLFVRHWMTIVQVSCIGISLMPKFQSHFLSKVNFFLIKDHVFPTLIFLHLLGKVLHAYFSLLLHFYFPTW
jgi:hypothetical protein